MAAAEQARLDSAEAVFELLVGGHKLGNIRIGELASMKRDLIASASQGLMLHTIEVRDAIIAETLARVALKSKSPVRARPRLIRS